jgi:hypothetical protein
MAKGTNHRAQSARLFYLFASHFQGIAPSLHVDLALRLFEARTFLGIDSKQRFRAKDARALCKKEIAELRRKKGRAVAARIKIKKQPAIGFKKPDADIVDEIFPIDSGPLDRFSGRRAAESMKANAVRGHEIEFLAEIWKRNTAFDSGNNAPNLQ